MPHARRYIKSNALYEITFRARDSLPFCCTKYMNCIILSILARVQRDSKVVVHHYILEGSHPHIICSARDADQCQRFYGQVQKQITDAAKRLLGVEHLRIWDGRATVNELPTLEDAIDKISYCYANPSNDDLESSIERYPGVSSWEAFLEAGAIDSCISAMIPWIRMPMIPKLPSRSVTRRQDGFICGKMLSSAKNKHLFKVYPNSWMKHFIDCDNPEEVSAVNQEIVAKLREKEAKNAARRLREGKKVLGAKRLRQQRFMQPHKPKKKGTKIFVQSKFKEIRIRIIMELKEIDQRCRQVYQRWKRGDFSVPWPPGTFPPPLPPFANALA